MSLNYCNIQHMQIIPNLQTGSILRGRLQIHLFAISLPVLHYWDVCFHYEQLWILDVHIVMKTIFSCS